MVRMAKTETINDKILKSVEIYKKYSFHPEVKSIEEFEPMTEKSSIGKDVIAGMQRPDIWKGKEVKLEKVLIKVDYEPDLLKPYCYDSTRFDTGDIFSECFESQEKLFSRLKDQHNLTFEDFIPKEKPKKEVKKEISVKTKEEVIPKEKVVYPKGKPTIKWTINQMRSYASDKGIYIKSGLKKEEVLKELLERIEEQKGLKNVKIINLDLKKKLNDEQYAVATNLNGNILVLAGAGSGKTRTITYSVANLLSQGVDPKEIVLMTFTRKAHEEMVSRVNDILGFKPSIVAGTFHSIANRFLSMNYKNLRFASLVGLPPNYEIISGDEFLFDVRKQIIRQKEDEIFKQQNPTWVLQKTTEYGKTVQRYFERGQQVPKKDYGRAKSDAYWKAEEIFPTTSEMVNIFSGMRNWKKTVKEMVEWQFPEYEESIREIGRVHQNYQKYKKYANKVDFGDLLVFWNELLEFDEVKDYAKNLKYFLIDEYQDTNILQNDVIKKLSNLGTAKLILSVGDDAQSIYAFRGANYENIMNFEKEFNAKRYDITYNYRSSPEILDFANDVISHNTKQSHKTMRPINPSFKEPIVVKSPKESQPELMIKIIKDLHDNEGINYGEFGVLSTTFINKNIKPLLTELEELLVKNEIPYDVRGGLSFFDRSHIKDIVSVFHILKYPTGRISRTLFVRLAKSYITGFGDTSADVINRKVINEEGNPLALFTDTTLFKKKIKEKGIKVSPSGLQNFFEFIEMAYSITTQKISFGDQVELLFNNKKFRTNFDRLYKTADDRDYKKRIEDVALLIEKGREFVSFRKFDQEVATGDWKAEEGDKPNKLILSTIHQAKGLEWEVVLMPFLEDNIMPHYNAIKEGANPEDIEEERRKFYVAVTRSKKYLYLFPPEEKTSLFIRELNANLYEEIPMNQI